MRVTFVNFTFVTCFGVGQIIGYVIILLIILVYFFVGKNSSVGDHLMLVTLKICKAHYN